MRTNINAAVTNRTVVGFGQDRVVSLWNDSCAYAAQHLASRHAAKRARGQATALKRRGSGPAVMAGTALMATPMCLAITGPQWQPVRHLSPELVTG